MNTTQDFAGHTSIHGIGHIFDRAMGAYDRLLWLAVSSIPQWWFLISITIKMLISIHSHKKMLSNQSNSLAGLSSPSFSLPSNILYLHCCHLHFDFQNHAKLSPSITTTHFHPHLYILVFISIFVLIWNFIFGFLILQVGLFTLFMIMIFQGSFLTPSTMHYGSGNGNREFQNF